MGYCPSCGKEISWLEIKRKRENFVELEGSSILERGGIKRKYYCPFCEELVAVTEGGARKILQSTKLENRVEDYSDRDL